MMSSAGRRLVRVAVPRVAAQPVRPRSMWSLHSSAVSPFQQLGRRCCATEAEPTDEERVELRKQADDLKEQLEALKGRLAMVKEDAVQQDRRQRTDLENETKYGFSKFAQTLLSVVDNLERASAAVKSEDLLTNAALAKTNGKVKYTIGAVKDAFEEFGITTMEPLDKPFDPNFHEAMFQVPMPGKEPNQIFHIMEPGYMIHDRCLRAAKVGIAK